MDTPQPQDPHIVVVNPQGRVSADGGTAIPLRDRLISAIEEGHGSVLLDVGQISYLDSLLLGELVQAYASAIKRGATLKLVNTTRRLRELLHITKLEKVLQTVDEDQK